MPRSTYSIRAGSIAAACTCGTHQTSVTRYDAPRARAPQAVLVVVPSDLTAGLEVDEARRAVLTARDLARARSVTSTPDDLSIGLPSGVVEAAGSAACTLSREAL